MTIKLFFSLFLFFLTNLLFSDSFAGYQYTNNPSLSVYLDLPSGTDVDFIRQEIPIVMYVRDKKLADVHIIISQHPAGSTGSTYSISFIGYGVYSDKNYMITYWAPASNTSDATRKGYTEKIKMGLVPYIASSPLADLITVACNMQVSEDIEKIIEYKDPWNNWVFEIYGGGSLNQEETKNSIHIRYGIFADRITKESKTRLRPYGNYVERNYKTDAGIITSTSVRGGFDSYFIKSVTDHWGAGVFADIFYSTYDNMRLSTVVSPAIEYSIFPYDEATRRSITFAWRIGVGYYDYAETTIFGKTSEYLFGQALIAAMDFRQPWGNVRSGLIGFHHMHDIRSNNIDLFTNLNLRIIEGLSLNLSGNLDLIRDLRAIPIADLSLEEILLEQRRRATSYQFSGNIGLSYTFGSKVTGIFNPRLSNAN